MRKGSDNQIAAAQAAKRDEDVPLIEIYESGDAVMVRSAE
jgi:hypothetical protein